MLSRRQKIRRVLRAQRMQRRAARALVRRVMLKANVDFRDPEVRRVLRNARKARGHAVFR